MNSVILEQPWHFFSPDPSLVNELAAKSSVPPLIAGLLFHRGINTTDAVTSHLTPVLSSLSDPWKMAGMEPAVERLIQAVKRREKITVFGDYDADGVTASTLVCRFLHDLGLAVDVYLPHREHEGYGLNPEAVKKIASTGCSLLITVDCGVSNQEEIALARSLDMDCIVTDHHEPPPALPAALAVLNPKRPDCRFPFKDLAGVGVAFNLIRALRHRLFELGHWKGSVHPNLKEYLDLVAIGTIADMVSLLGDNRILVKAGLEIIESGARPGIAALKVVSSISSGSVSASHVAYRIAPRINAAGRMDHSETAFRLLMERDAGEAARLAAQLEALNRERQAVERRIMAEALKKIRGMPGRDAYVVSDGGWKKGVIGIVASKLMNRLSRPVILLAEDALEAHGSGRSPEGLNIYEALSCCGNHLISFGGHKAAAGLRLPAASVDEFTTAFEQTVASMLRDRDIRPRLMIDATADVSELLAPEFAEIYEQLEPFGHGYPEPLFAIHNFTVKRSAVVGRRHLKLTLGPDAPEDILIPPGELELVGWGHGDKIGLSWDEFEIACIPCFNEWRGRKRLQLKLWDIRQK
ncbi:MAG TPA: single-stranded-DNA-specific exonuclease RecJ [Thermodesulfobacteriaceae bacterium]|nr:single-stranded-DNA-specific exonuclease RecJ [Thermodesulfobacteriaceae bacterium]